MKLVILGATGGTGLCLIQQAVDKGHEVVAIMRNPSRLTIRHDNLKAVEADIFSTLSLSEHFLGCDAVMSCLGATTYRNTTLYSETMKIIADAMKKSNVSRFVAVTSWCTSDNPNDRGPFVMEWILKPTILKRALADMDLMEHFLIDSCDHINYTVVRPPELNNKAVSEKEFAIEVDRLHVPGGPYNIARADLARFMLVCLTSDIYNKKMVAITA